MLHLVCSDNKIYFLNLFIFLILDASAENDEQSEEVFAESYDERDDHHSSAIIPKKVYLLPKISINYLYV